MWKATRKEDEFSTPAPEQPAPKAAYTPPPPVARAAEPVRADAPRSVDVATIGKSVIVKGELSGSEDLYVDGEVEGSICLARPEPHHRAERTGSRQHRSPQRDRAWPGRRQHPGQRPCRIAQERIVVGRYFDRARRHRRRRLFQGLDRHPESRTRASARTEATSGRCCPGSSCRACSGCRASSPRLIARTQKILIRTQTLAGRVRSVPLFCRHSINRLCPS